MGKRLFVGGVSFNTTDDALRDAFAQAGNVTSAQIIKDRETGRSKGFGFVEYATDEEAAKGVELWNNKELDGRTIRVSEARPMAPRAPRAGGNGGGGASGFGGGGY